MDYNTDKKPSSKPESTESYMALRGGSRVTPRADTGAAVGLPRD